MSDRDDMRLALTVFGIPMLGAAAFIAWFFYRFMTAAGQALGAAVKLLNASAGFLQ